MEAMVELASLGKNQIAYWLGATAGAQEAALRGVPHRTWKLHKVCQHLPIVCSCLPLGAPRKGNE